MRILLDRLRSMVAELPDGASVTLPVEVLRSWIEEDGGPSRPMELTSPRERLWTYHPETRLNVEQLADALGKAESWVYRRTGPSAEERLPCRKLDGSLCFVVGEIREWLKDHEEIVVPGDARRLAALVAGKNLPTRLPKPSEAA